MDVARSLVLKQLGGEGSAYTSTQLHMACKVAALLHCCCDRASLSPPPLMRLMPSCAYVYMRYTDALVLSCVCEMCCQLSSTMVDAH